MLVAVSVAAIIAAGEVVMTMLDVTHGIVTAPSHRPCDLLLEATGLLRDSLRAGGCSPLPKVGGLTLTDTSVAGGAATCS